MSKTTKYFRGISDSSHNPRVYLTRVNGLGFAKFDSGWRYVDIPKSSTDDCEARGPNFIDRVHLLESIENFCFSFGYPREGPYPF